MSRSTPIVAYVKFSLIGLTSMMFGSQLVHNRYKPLDDLDEYVEREIKKLEEAAKGLET